MSKNIVVFSDGTAKEGGQGPNTNVYKLFNMIEDRTADQVAFYDRGLGTALKLSLNSTRWLSPCWIKSLTFMTVH